MYTAIKGHAAKQQHIIRKSIKKEVDLRHVIAALVVISAWILMVFVFEFGGFVS